MNDILETPSATSQTTATINQSVLIVTRKCATREMLCREWAAKLVMDRFSSVLLRNRGSERIYELILVY